MGLTFPIIGTYNASKADWFATTETGQSVNNYQRWVYAHSTVLGDLPTASSYFTRSFNFNCIPQFPDNDSSLRTAAHNAGVADGGNVAHGSDFLMLGNYVGSQVISNISGWTFPNGLLYWAGQPLANGGSTGAITRDWLEVISTVNLTTTIPLTNGNNYQINVSDCSSITNSPNIVMGYPTDSPHILSSGDEDSFIQMYGTSLNEVVSVTINGGNANFFQWNPDTTWYSEAYAIAYNNGPGKFCVVITDITGGKYCFYVIVVATAGDSCSNAAATQYPLGSIVYIPSDGSSLWYSFVPASTGFATMQFCMSNITSAGVFFASVYTGSCASLSGILTLTRTTASCTNGSFLVNAGQTYWLELRSTGGGEGKATVTIS